MSLGASSVIKKVEGFDQRGHNTILKKELPGVNDND
jgi:hypothetical protein